MPPVSAKATTSSMVNPAATATRKTGRRRGSDASRSASVDTNSSRGCGRSCSRRRSKRPRLLLPRIFPSQGLRFGSSLGLPLRGAFSYIELLTQLTNLRRKRVERRGAVEGTPSRVGLARKRGPEPQLPVAVVLGDGLAVESASAGEGPVDENGVSLALQRFR